MTIFLTESRYRKDTHSLLHMLDGGNMNFWLPIRNGIAPYFLLGHCGRVVLHFFP